MAPPKYPTSSNNHGHPFSHEVLLHNMAITFSFACASPSEGNSSSSLPAAWVASCSGEECFSLLACTVPKALATQSQPESPGSYVIEAATKRKEAAKVPLRFLSESKTLKISPRSFHEQNPSFLTLPL